MLDNISKVQQNSSDKRHLKFPRIQNDRSLLPSWGFFFNLCNLFSLIQVNKIKWKSHLFYCLLLSFCGLLTSALLIRINLYSLYFLLKKFFRELNECPHVVDWHIFLFERVQWGQPVCVFFIQPLSCSVLLVELPLLSLASFNRFPPSDALIRFAFTVYHFNSSHWLKECPQNFEFSLPFQHVIKPPDEPIED